MTKKDDLEQGGDPIAAPDELTALVQERDDYKDRLLRMTAEFDNYRKRIDRERRDLSEAAGLDMMRDILPVLDDFERALAAGSPGDPLHKGIELIHRQLFEVLRKRGVEPVPALGLPFNPEWHESVGHEPANGRPDAEVVTEVRRGYRIGSRLLRPTLVRVAQA